MLINHEHKIIFVHIFRTGGTSIRFALRNAGIKLEIIGSEHGKCPRHIYPQYYKFSVVRNPYEWLLSVYSLISGATDHPFQSIVRRNDFTWFVKWYIDCCKLEMGTYSRQSDFIGDRKGITVDNWFKLEELHDLKYALRRRLKRDIVIPHVHSFPRRCELEGIPMINEFFRKDFETFNYEMRRTDGAY